MTEFSVSFVQESERKGEEEKGRRGEKEKNHLPPLLFFLSSPSAGGFQ
jgi:hypothetical protein